VVDPNQDISGAAVLCWMEIARRAERLSTMPIHKKILDWQAANPTITWIFWGIVWIIVFILLFSPSNTAAL
jgi:hypothetical protein